MNYRDEDDPFEEDIVFDQAGLLSTSRKSSKSAIRRVSSGKCAVFSKTLGLCGAFLGLGLTCAIPGPLSPVPPTELREDISLMSYEVMYRCQGFMIGAMFGARLLDRFNRLFLVFLALLVTALLVTIIPWCGIVWLLRTDMFLLGACLGFLSTGGNVLCLDLWGRNSGPFMQALHFSFSLGLFLAPFLSQPLMAPLNNLIVIPSTTLAPAMFPLHRLPRDVQNFSTPASMEVKVPLFVASSVPHPLYSNLTAASSTSTTATPGQQILEHQLSTLSNSPKATVSSFLNTTAIPTVTKLVSSTMRSSTPVSSITAMPAVSQGMAVTHGHEATSSLSNKDKESSSSTIATPLSLSSGTPLSKDALKSDLLSTTTHRAPRPKPVLTNSEKLQDKNWENDKFRKPPPEDLVPISTTMKAMVHLKNVTVGTSHIESNSTLPSALPAINSTLSPNSVLNTTKATDLSLKLESTNYTSTTPKLNSSLISTEASPTATSKVSSSTSTISPSSSTAASVNVTNPSTTASASVTNHSLQSDADNIPGVMSAKDAEAVLGTLKNNSESNQKSSDLSYKHEIVDVNEPKANASVNNQEELTLPLLEDPSAYNDSRDNVKDGSWQAGISLDEQELSAQNGTKLTSTVATKMLPTLASTESYLKSTKLSPIATKNSLKAIINPDLVNHSTQKPLLQLSTPHADVIFKHDDNEKAGLVTKKYLGQSHVESKQKSSPSPSNESEQAIRLREPMTFSQNHSLSLSHKAAVNTTPLVLENSTPLSQSSYLGPHLSPKHTHHSKPASTVVNDTEVTHTVIDAFANRLEKYGLSKMQLMYLTVGMVLLATSFLFLGFLCFNPRDPKSKTEEEEMNGHIARGGSRNRMSVGQSVPQSSKRLRLTLLGLMFLLLMITSGVQAMYGQLLLLYAMQSPLQLSQSTGAALTSTFLGALTSTRFACILLASALSPTAMLVLSVAICSCATWLLSALATSSEVALWIGSVMVGVGTASVIPSGLLWMQRHVLITHRVAAMLVMGPAMGEMLFPTLAFKMMVSMGPASLVHLPALLSLIAIALWAAEWRLARYPRQPLCSPADDPSGYQLANQHDEDDLLDLTMSPIINGTNLAPRGSSRSYANGHSSHRMSA